MQSFRVMEDRWGFYVIMDERTGKAMAYTRHRSRAEQIVGRLNTEPGQEAERAIRLPEAPEPTESQQRVSLSGASRSRPARWSMR